MQKRWWAQTNRLPGLPQAGFTLLELLVVIGLIALLASLLLPAVTASRRQARTLQCAMNMRRICTALLMYASETGRRFPPNLSTLGGKYWYDRDRAGKYLENGTSVVSNGPGGPGLACPEDEGAKRSYAMNIWASGQVDKPVLAAPLRGSLWDSQVKQPHKAILAAERWSSAGSKTAGWFAPATLGFAGSPGQRFGAQTGLVPALFAGRWGYVNCELPFARHRPKGDNAGTAPWGRVNIGYVDGHVALKAHDELADPQTGKSTLDSLWSPMDPLLN